MSHVVSRRAILVTALLGLLGLAYGRGAFLAVRAADLSVFHSEPPITADVDLHPETLNCRSSGNVITAQVRGSFESDDIQRDAVELRVDGRTGSVAAEAHPGQPFKFDRAAVCALIDGQSGDLTVFVSGALTGGRSFRGADTIRAL